MNNTRSIQDRIRHAIDTSIAEKRIVDMPWSEATGRILSGECELCTEIAKPRLTRYFGVNVDGNEWRVNLHGPVVFRKG